MMPILGGVTIIGPLAATMSTISSLLIAGSSAIVKDMYLHYKEEKHEEINQKFVAKISFAVTAVMGIAAVVMAINPPDLMDHASWTVLEESKLYRCIDECNRRSGCLLCYHGTGN